MNTYLLWENEEFEIVTPKNPHQAYSEGLHIIVVPKQEFPCAWKDTERAGRAFILASEACKIMEDLQLAPWFNLQANGNWGLLPGKEPFFHIHVYGRNKTGSWGKPIVLPEAPKTFQNDPMPEVDQAKLIEAFKASLSTK